MRIIKRVVVHCSDSDLPSHDSLQTIRIWHMVERGFRDVGYHKLIFKSEGLVNGRPLEMQGAHCEGENGDTIGVMLAGRHTFTKEQFWLAAVEIDRLCKIYNIPLTEIYPHKAFNSEKTCPNFDIEVEIINRIKMIRAY